MKDLNFIVSEIATKLSKEFESPNNDSGLFDSVFCHELEKLIERTVQKEQDRP